MDVPVDLAVQLAALSRAFEHEDLDAALHHVAVTCGALVPGTTGCSVTLWRDAGPYTAAVTDDAVAAVDRAQYDARSGPCVDAARAGKAVLVRDLREDRAWPAFSAAALRHGFRSALALPLAIGPQVAGALNLYGATPFTDRARELASLVAAHGAGAVMTSTALFEARQHAEHMRAALDSRAVIDRAVGVVMAQEGVDQQQAFALLVARSQNGNRKLRVVAAELVADFDG